MNNINIISKHFLTGFLFYRQIKYQLIKLKYSVIRYERANTLLMFNKMHQASENCIQRIIYLTINSKKKKIKKK